ncbi:MAG: type III-A CRISPR-associated protein Csm2 [bacterium]|nr:type III-A CRISPR-associated protein Csm2 [bacterium]
MITFWKDKSKKQIQTELFSKTAEELAEKVFNESRNKTTNKPTQIRKFYNEVLRYKTDPDEFEKILPYLKMLTAKAAYAVGRKLISDGFKNFIEESLKNIKDKDDFDAFAGLFEAFMGYYKFHYEKEGDRG